MKEERFERVVEWEEEPIHEVNIPIFIGIIAFFCLSIWGGLPKTYFTGCFLTIWYSILVFESIRNSGKGRKVYWRKIQ